MSYARWSADSSVYVYEDVAGGWTCCGCLLDPGDNPLGEFESLNLPTRWDMLWHLIDHQRNGHKVPAFAISRLGREISDELENYIWRKNDH